MTIPRRRAAARVAALLLAAAGALAACAEDVRREPATLAALAQAAPVVRLAAEAKGFSTAGYASTLRAGTRWQAVGSVPQGEVLKPLDTVLAAEGAHVREAYAVVRGGSWVGFWLPVERAFSPLQAPVAVTFGGDGR